MKVITGLDNIEKIPPHAIATIGVFDGVHRGHLAILKKIVSRAKYFNSPSLVITFVPRHCGIIKSNFMPRFLISLRHRLFLFERLGVNYCLVINFDRDFARISASRFIDKFIVKTLNLREIYVGRDFRFGRGKEGDVKFLKECGRKFGFKTGIIMPIKYQGKIISSSWIRKEIKKGNLSLINRILGRPLSIYGRVIKGRGVGSFLGFPTANLNTEHDIIPPRGVYAVRVLLKDRVFKGLLNIGFRPTFLNKKIALSRLTPEVHLFGFKGNLYNKFLEVELLRRIRPEKKFNSADSLVSAIRKDVSCSRRILSKI